MPIEVVSIDETDAAAPSGAMRRQEAFSADSGTEQLWAGFNEVPPGSVSAVHHHGPSETIAFVLSGVARFASGPKLAHVVDATAGDFVFIPAHEIHVESNPSDDETLRVLLVRSAPRQVVVNVDPPPGWKPSDLA